jgi:hypothetical protein
MAWALTKGQQRINQEIARLQSIGKLPPMIRRISITIGLDEAVTIHCDCIADESHLDLIEACMQEGRVDIDGMATTLTQARSNKQGE